MRFASSGIGNFDMEMASIGGKIKGRTLSVSPNRRVYFIHMSY